MTPEQWQRLPNALMQRMQNAKNAEGAVENSDDGRGSFECPIGGCICAYDSDAGLQKHLPVGSPVRRLHRESQFDHIKRKYADIVTVNDTLQC